MQAMKKTFGVLGLAGLACAIGAGALPSAQTTGGCASSASTRPPNGLKTSHAYFEALVARADCIAAFSLRDNAQLQQFSHAKRLPQRVTYDPAHDGDPRRQDAAKIVVPAGQVSLRNTVRLPLGTVDGTTTLVTWDAWFGAEFRYPNTGIPTYKTFQFASPKRIWFEVRTRFSLVEPPNIRRAVRAQSKRVAGGVQEAPSPPSAAGESREGIDIGVVDARAYMQVGPNVQRRQTLTPQAGTFTVRAETWTRYWVLIEQRANDWDPVSLWVADENHDPVQIIDRRQLSVNGSVEFFWLQYNTSAHPRPGLGERIGYARNFVALRNVKDLSSLLQRPSK